MILCVYTVLCVKSTIMITVRKTTFNFIIQHFYHIVGKVNTLEFIKQANYFIDTFS